MDLLNILFGQKENITIISGDLSKSYLTEMIDLELDKTITQFVVGSITRIPRKHSGLINRIGHFVQQKLAIHLENNVTISQRKLNTFNNNFGFIEEDQIKSHCIGDYEDTLLAF
jgi:hypothetical protein